MDKIRSVLLIDDDEPTNFIHKKIIQNSGLVNDIQIAHSGSEALQLLGFYQINEIPAPDIVFLDINMPAMDGWEFLDQYMKLKNVPALKIVIVMLTTSLNPDDEVRSGESKEVFEFRNKPLTKQMLLEIINKYF